MAFFINPNALCTYGYQSSSSIFIHKHECIYIHTENWKQGYKDN